MAGFVYFLVGVSMTFIAQGAVDRSNCVQSYGSYGEDVSCPRDYLPVGLCSSGRYGDCEGHWTILKCCKEIQGSVAPSSSVCTSQGSNNGHFAFCGPDRVVASVCTSGSRADCGRKQYTRLMCCSAHTQRLGSCSEHSGWYGEFVQCAQNEVITAVCTSGSKPDCKRQYTRIRCCSME